jgi:hypothetical protein
MGKTLGKHGRGLDPNLMAWVAATLQLGPGLGQPRFVVKVDSAYYSFLRDDLKMDTSIVHHSLQEAEDACTSARNDVILVYPGAYLESAELAWDKTNTHIVGLSGPNTMGDYYEPGAVIYTTGTSVATVVNITGPNTQFHNIALQNAGNNAACLSAMIVNKYACLFKNVGLMGNMTDNQNTTVAAATLYIGTDGHTPIFDNCVIGQDVWGVRSGANSGQVRFTGSQPNDGIFRRCIFRSISNTATCAMVAAPSGTSIGRGWVFDNCQFFNFSTNATAMNQVFYAGASGWQPIVMHNSCAHGYDRWTDKDTYQVFGNMPVADDGGGLTISLDQTVAGGS